MVCERWGISSSVIRYLGVACVPFLSGCFSSSSEPKRNLESWTQRTGVVISAGDGSDPVIREERSAEEVLQSQVWVNHRVADDVAFEKHRLQRCRRDLSDPRLGGVSNLVDLPEGYEGKNTQKEESLVLADNGDLLIVSKQSYIQRLEDERARERVLRATVTRVRDLARDCGKRLREARIRVGLPGEPFQAEGHFDLEGNWVVERPAEQTLDDGFRILGQVRARAARR